MVKGFQCPVFKRPLSVWVQTRLAAPLTWPGAPLDTLEHVSHGGKSLSIFFY